jgi:threonine synthase
MNFVSTRGLSEPHSFSEAVKIGLAPDGGLFVPEILPSLSMKLSGWECKSYPELCASFFREFATDIDEEELVALVEEAYSNFDHPEYAPLVSLSESISVLELFHGPTLAFKDFALQLLGKLYERQVSKTGLSINVLGATSGDTGAAAISGLVGKKGVNIFILYPDGRVSSLQERQMTCTGETNVYPMAITGSFDEAQAALKEVFGDRDFSRAVNLSAVNSINLARILAQCVYYLHAWLKLPVGQREKTTFVVPTGNFGNVLAGWMASQMGMKVAGFRVATNRNDILHRFFSSGDYSVDDASVSLAPSMDIQVASNFERYLYFGLGEDTDKTRETMSEFKQKGKFELRDDSLIKSMSSSRMDDSEIFETIRNVYDKYGYVADPHTACAFKDLDEFEHCVILSTAHPAKFPETIEETLGISFTHPSLDSLKERQIVKHPISANADAIKEFIVSKQKPVQS